jgi:hypothetical protein
MIELENKSEIHYVDPRAVAQLLWRDEALAALKLRNLSKGALSKPRKVLWDRLVENVPAPELCAIVRNQLLTRPQWR